MSELVNAKNTHADFNQRLLATVSAIALIGSVYGAGEAKAAEDESDRPILWVELGGQLSRLDEGQDTFAPSIMDGRPSIFSPSQKFEKLPLYGVDETGKISFEPGNDGWVLSASVTYGRSSNVKHVHQQTYPAPHVTHFTIIRGSSTPPNVINVTHFPIGERFADTIVRSDQSHSIVDFQAGKDVGLGLFGGKGGAPVFSLGVRFAQFSNNTVVSLKSDPDFHRQYKYFTFPPWHVYGVKEAHGSGYHSNAASLTAARSFHGIGPSLSWNASAAFMGDRQTSELAFDWGVNAAILFGRQRAAVHHQMTEHYHPASGYTQGGGYWRQCYGCRETIAQPPPVNLVRSHMVIVPNLGGFAGLSFHYANAKISAGYRADFFWGAMDGGIDAAKKENVGFYGPFATISVGVGG